MCIRDRYKAKIGVDFPTDPKEQLMGAIKAVFRSWDNPRANVYRRDNDIPYSCLLYTSGTARAVPRGIYPSITSSSIITRKPHMTLAVPTWECSPRWASGISSSTTT